MTYSIIPNEKELDEMLALAEEYGANFEYNDFFLPEVYEDEQEIERLIALYSSLGRSRAGDTLHGAFMGLDIASDDAVIRERSRELFCRSMNIAKRLGVRAVVFHTGMASGLNQRSYADEWLRRAEGFLRRLCADFSDIDVYLENTFEQEPYIFAQAAKALSDVPNFGLCLDHAHAALTKTPVKTWFSELSPHIRHIHVNDNDLQSDLHLAAGDGCIDLAWFLTLAEKYAQDASVLIEVRGAEKAHRSLGYLSALRPCGAEHDSGDTLGKFLDIGIALTAERDPDKLLDYIVDTAMSLTNSDGGTLYILEDNVLKFRIMKTRSKGIDLGGDGIAPDIPPVQMKMENICAYSVLTGRSLNIRDVYNCDEFDFSGPKKYDELNGYRTRSMVVIPLLNKENEAIGVLQLINAKRGEYTGEEERLIRSLGSQTAIALANMNYTRELNEQLWSFTEALAQAMGKLTRYNENHTRNVAKYCEMIARHINALHDKGLTNEYFDEERMERLRMAALLHDIGKLVTPLEVMNKPSKLGDKLAPLMSRLDIAALKAENAFLRNEMQKDEYDGVIHDINECREVVTSVNNAEFLNDELSAKLQKIFGYSFRGEKLITDDEREALSVKRGTLTDAERGIMNGHVSETAKILAEVKFNSRFNGVREIAARHHELLDGSGYPDHLGADELCLEVRILTVADIYDALTADDRPYKKAKTPDEAFRILGFNVSDGKIDGGIVGYLKECLGA